MSEQSEPSAEFPTNESRRAVSISELLGEEDGPYGKFAEDYKEGGAVVFVPEVDGAIDEAGDGQAPESEIIVPGDPDFTYKQPN